jgi:hypothetical protein
MFAIAIEATRIFNGVLLLDERGPPAVFEIIASLAAHEGILDAAEVNPHMRKLVDE